jgi:hypothetical protein
MTSQRITRSDVSAASRRRCGGSLLVGLGAVTLLEESNLQPTAAYLSARTVPDCSGFAVFSRFRCLPEIPLSQ